MFRSRGSFGLERTTIVVLVLALSCPRAGSADEAQQVPLGARAMAMGSAFCSIADDATAPYWNPAGLPWIGHQEVTGAHANLFNSGIRDNFLASVLPLTPRDAVALDWYHSGFEDSELGFGENRIDLAYGRKLLPFLSAGVTAKYMGRNTALDGVEVRRGHGFGADFGAIVRPWDRLRLAVTLQDAFRTKVTYTGGDGSVLAYDRNLRVGASYRVLEDAVLAFDLDGRRHMGAEYQVFPQLALRAGLEDDPRFDDGLSTSFGAGVKLGLMRFDYALVDRPFVGSTSHFALSLGFHFNPSQIRIEKVEARNLYGSFYKTYAQEPFGSVTVRNLDDKPVSATVRVLVPELADVPSEQQVLLRPKAAQEIPLTAVLSDDIMRRKGDRPVQVQVTATYQSRRLPRTERASARCVAYGPGAIDWSGGVAQAAAFVTMRDQVVDAVAREAIRTLATTGEIPPSQRSIAYAAAIFDALGALGIAYVPDPNNPYSSIAETAHAVDAISYPQETLVRRTGDCDDTTVLFAALLGNVGIATQLVDVPGHLFLLLDTGVHERNRLSLAVDEGRYVIADDEVWIPVETTAIGEGFARAWESGAEAYGSWAGRGKLVLASVEEAQARFEPAELPGDAVAPALDGDRLGARVTEDLRTIDGWRRAYLAGRFGASLTDQVVSAEALNELAHVHFFAGDMDQAMAHLHRALLLDGGSARTHNNLGNVLAARGDVMGALEHYLTAAGLEEGDAGVWLNIGLTRYASGDTAGADDPLAKCIERSGSYVAACRLLGLEPELAADRQGTPNMSAEEARQLLRAALRRVPAAGAPAPSPSDSIETRRIVAPRWRGRVGGSRGREAPLTDFLYWKS